MADKKTERAKWVRFGLFVVAFLLGVRALNVPEEAPYLLWIAMLIMFGALIEVAYQSSKRW